MILKGIKTVIVVTGRHETSKKEGNQFCRAKQRHSPKYEFVEMMHATYKIV